MASTLQREWKTQFGTDPPSRKTISALNKKFDETGSVADLIRTGRPKTSRTQEKIALVQNAIKRDPTKSIRVLSHELGLNKASVHRIKQDTDKNGYLKQENKRLKEKLIELQKRNDILEGRKPSQKNARKPSKDNIILLPELVDPYVKPTPYIISRITDSQDLDEISEYELVRLEDQHGQALTVENGSCSSTVITVLTNNENDDHTFELNHGQEVCHLTIDMNGQLQEVENDLNEETVEVFEHDEDAEHNRMDAEILANEHQDAETITGELLLVDDEQEHTITIQHELLGEGLHEGLAHPQQC